MRFLVKSHDEYGPNFAVLFNALPTIYGDENLYGEVLKIDVMRDASELTHRIEIDAWRPYLGESANPLQRRALVLPIDLLLQGENSPEAWRNFALEALNERTIGGEKLAGDVDLIVLARQTEHPEIFSGRKPDCSLLVDYTHLLPHKGIEGAVAILTEALASGTPAMPKDKIIDAKGSEIPKSRRVESDDGFQP